MIMTCEGKRAVEKEGHGRKSGLLYEVKGIPRLSQICELADSPYAISRKVFLK